jgi:hypothetical protein
MKDRGYHGSIELFVLGSGAIPEIGITENSLYRTAQLFQAEMMPRMGYIEISMGNSSVAVRAEFKYSTLVLIL